MVNLFHNIISMLSTKGTLVNNDSAFIEANLSELSSFRGDNLHIVSVLDLNMKVLLGKGILWHIGIASDSSTSEY